MKAGRASYERSRPSWEEYRDGTIGVKGTGGYYQVKTGPDKDGGPSVISVYSPDGQVTIFSEVHKAVRELRKKGVNSTNLRRLHRVLPAELREWRRRARQYKAGSVGYSEDTEV